MDLGALESFTILKENNIESDILAAIYLTNLS